MKDRFETDSQVNWKGIISMVNALSSLIVTFLVSGMLHSANAASSCEGDTLKSTLDNGSVIVMVSGIAYLVAEEDRPDAVMWLPGEKVLICVLPTFEVKIVNLDQDGISILAELK